MKKNYNKILLNSCYFFIERKKKRKIKPNIVLDELKVGDLVVHQDYGIGKFLGIEPITVLGATKDFLKITI